MRPLLFGSAERKLHGVYHPPTSSSPRGRDAGVVLCYPGAQEYNACHPAFRKLAAMLARSGLHVFRFDFFGTGDSAGESSEGEPSAWVADIRSAAGELKDLAGVRAVSLVGLRLGAALAVRAVAEGLAVQDLVLWDPVVVGRDYIAELEARNRKHDLMRLHPTSRFAPPRDELVGFPFPPSLRAALGAIDLRTSPRLPASRMFLTVSEERPAYHELRTALASQGNVRYRLVTEDGTQSKVDATEGVLLASKILVAIHDAILDGNA